MPQSIWHKLLQIDAQATRHIRLPSETSPWWKPAVILAHSGDSWLWATGVGLVWLFAGTAWHRYAATLEIGIVFQALFVFGIKFLFHRKRPEGEWGGIYRQFDPHSFPSGHATRAVLLAVLASGLGPAWFALLMSAWAPLVCLSRVMTGVHYISDILGGMLLGLGMGLVFVSANPLIMRLLPFLF
jgi:undecaprenyl-diphosphatase